MDSCQLAGLKELKKDIKAEKIVSMKTDKSSKLSIETKESYVKAAQTHIEGDIVTDAKECDKIEKMFNGYAKGMRRFLMAGESHGQASVKRVVEAVTTEKTTVPPMFLFGKDHKPIEDPTQGPKRRSVVGCSEGPAFRFTNMVSELLNAVSDAEEWDGECRSTEELQAAIEDLNERLRIKS